MKRIIYLLLHLFIITNSFGQSKPDGEYKSYDSKGQISEIGFYKNNKREGKWEIYYNGKLVAYGLYKNDMKEGVWYDNTMSSRESGTYSNGLKEGQWTTSHFNGKIESIGLYKSGRREGEWKTYYSNGQLARIGIYINGNEEGKWKTYHFNRNFKMQLEEIGTYKNGLREGKWEEYNDNGQIISTKYYKHGTTDGQGKPTINKVVKPKIKSIKTNN